jgi:hypothetical protein
MKAKQIFNMVKKYPDWKRRANVMCFNDEQLQKVKDLMVKNGLAEKEKVLSDVEKLEKLLIEGGVMK